MDRPQRLARKQENLTAEKHGGQVTPASGSGRTVKNDVRNHEWSIEVKSTSALSYSLKAETLVLAEKHALVDGRRMALVVAFVGRMLARPRRYVVTTEDDFLEREQEIETLKQAVKRLDEENWKLWSKIEADC